MDINQYTPHRQGTHTIFTSSENHCTHIANNPSGKYIRQFKVDGEVFPRSSDIKRCDYLLLNDEDKTSYYIELKGSDIITAIEQIENTISLLAPSIKDYPTIFRRIIYRTSTLSLKNNYVIKWAKKHNAIIKSRTYAETL